MKVFDARRLLGGDEDRQKATGRLEDDDGYYWLCPDCFRHMRETLPVVVGGDLNDNSPCWSFYVDHFLCFSQEYKANSWFAK